MRRVATAALTGALFLALAGGPAWAQVDEEKEQLRKELIQKVDQKLRALRQELIRDIDKRLGIAPKGPETRAPERPAPPAAKGDGKAFLGISLREIRPGLRTLLGIPEGQGVLVNGVAPGSPAEKAGLVRTDVIVAWNGQTVDGPDGIISRVGKHKAGDQVKLAIFRQGQKMDVTVTLGGRPSDEPGAPPAKGPESRKGPEPRGEKDLERFLDRALEDAKQKGDKGARQPRPGPGARPPREMFGDPEQMQKMMEQMFGPDGGKQFQEMLQRGMKMYEEMMKDPETRKQMQQMMEQFFGGKGGQGQQDMQKYLERMLNPEGRKPEPGQPAEPRAQPKKGSDRERVDRMLDDLLGDKKNGKKAEPRKEPAKEGPRPPAAGQGGWLGVSLAPLNDTLRHQLSLAEGEGVLIQNLVPGGPAEKSGLARFDVLVELAGKKIGSVEDARAVVGSHKPGATLEAGIVRHGKRQKIAVTLGAEPKSDFK